MLNRTGFLKSMGLVGVLLLLVSCMPQPNPGNTTLPGGAISVDGQPTAINHRDVVLAITPASGAFQMQVADGPDPSGAAWQSVADTLEWTLPDGDGEKVISARFRSSKRMSSVVSSTIVLDTVAPELAITSHVDGAVIDVSDGALQSIAGTSTDAGSGVESVVMSAQGESSEATVGTDGAWALPVDSYETRTLDLTATATDVAGNTADRPLQVTIVGLPASSEPVARPTTLRLDDPALVAGVADGQLTLTGDQQALLAGKSVVMSERIEGVAPDGLLREVLAVEYDAGTDTTVLATEQAELLDAFARFSADEPEALPDEAPLRSNSSSSLENSACNEELSRYDLSVQNDWILEEAAPLFDFQTDAYVGMFADLSLSVDVGLFSVDVTGGASAGVLLCANTTVTVLGEVKAALPIAGIQQVFDKFTRAACFPVAGIPVCLKAQPELRLSTKGEGNFAFSGFFGFRAGASTGGYDGADKHSTEVLGDLNLDDATPRLSVSLGMPYFSVGLKVAEVVGVNFASASFGPVLETTPSGSQFCIRAQADVKLELQLDLKVVTFKAVVARATLVEFDFFCQEWEDDELPTTTTTTTTSTTSSTTTSTTPTSTTTTTIPAGTRPLTIRMRDGFFFPETPQWFRDQMIAFNEVTIYDATREVVLATGTTNGDGVVYIPDDIAGPVIVHMVEDCVYNFEGAFDFEAGSENLTIQIPLDQLCT